MFGRGCRPGRPSPCRAGWAARGHVLASTRIRPAIGPVEARDEAERRRLAAAGRAEQREELRPPRARGRSRPARRPPRTAPQLLELDVGHQWLHPPGARPRPTSRSASIASHGDAEAHERHGRRGVGLRLVDVLDVGREGVEGREHCDRELAHHDRERQEAPASAAARMLGRITRRSVVRQGAPRLCDASVSVCTSIARKPVSSEKYMYGKARIT